MKMKRFAAAVLSGLTALCSVMQLPAGAISLSDYTVRNAAAEPETANDLPERYDMRKAGLTTRVQDQGSNGICWSFSALAALESTLIGKEPAIDFSEWSLAYFAYSPLFGYEKGEMVPFKNGGGVTVAAPMLTGWLGPVPQADFPDSDLTGKELDLTAEELREKAVYHVSDVEIFMSDQNSEVTEELLQTVKERVYGGHAVSVIYYNESGAQREDTAAFYNPDYRIDKTEMSKYHAVTIVGWDDAFPAGYFKTNAGRDGAFLCKNSWGAKNGDNGYFWLSYAEPSISELYTVSAEPVQNHAKQYQYDTYGFCRGMAIGAADTTAYMANCFTAEEDTVLTSVMFVTAMPEDAYTIHVYQDVQDAADPTSGKETATLNGTKAYPGYYTEDLETPVFLSKGERFSIVVKLSGKQGQHIPCEAYARFTTETKDGKVTVDAETLYPEKMIVRDFNAGESFVSPDGLHWADMYEYEPIDRDIEVLKDGTVRHVYGKLGNVCVRALTQDIGRVMFSEYCEEVPEGTEITLTCPGASEIRYSIDGETYSLYESPVAVEGDVTLSAYAVIDGVQYPVTEQHYKPAVAQISSMLRTDTKEYLEFERIADDCWTVYCERGSEELMLLPVTTAEIRGGEAVFNSYDLMWVKAENALTLYTHEEGKRDGTYVLYLTDEIRGNVNLDDDVNAIDATEVLIYSAKSGAGIEDPSKDAAWFARADCDGNGVVNAEDATWILKYAASRGVGK